MSAQIRVSLIAVLLAAFVALLWLDLEYDDGTPSHTVYFAILRLMIFIALAVEYVAYHRHMRSR